MSPTFSFAPEAREELLDTIRYYEAGSPGLGASFLGAFNDALDQLLAFPESAPILHRKVRCKPLRRFPYSLLYSLRRQEIRILAVMNQSRQPLYWRSRR